MFLFGDAAHAHQGVAHAAEGGIDAHTRNLGNLFEQELDEVLASPRARAIYDGFTKHKAVEPLCRRCGYAAVIKKLLDRG